MKVLFCCFLYLLSISPFCFFLSHHSFIYYCILLFFHTHWSDNSQSNSTPLLSLSLILSSVLTPSSNPSHCPGACCSSMCDWWRGASIPSSATQHSSVPKAPTSFSLTCRHQMAHHLPPTVNKSCNYPSCPTKGNSHFNKCTVHPHTPTHTRTYTRTDAWQDIQISNTKKVNCVTMHTITQLQMLLFFI